MISVFTPQYKHRPVSGDERLGRAIANPLDPADTLPQKCGDCGAPSSFDNPLMMKPLFRMDHGGPKGELYQARCAHCQEKHARARGL